MALYQNTTVHSSMLVIGNYKIEAAASAGGAFINLGAGMVNDWGHNITKYDVQSGNAPDPIEGISEETFTVTGELIEFDMSVMSMIQCGATSYVSGASVLTLLGGGNAVQTPICFRLTNRRIISGATKETILLVYNATLDGGVSCSAKSDNDTNPINTFPFAITGKPDTSLTAGSQLFKITRDV
jgi:hypothetical protein